MIETPEDRKILFFTDFSCKNDKIPGSHAVIRQPDVQMIR